MNTALRTAPHYFVIDSIGGMNEGYSDTTCRRIEDVAAPELAKAMVEEYIDQWIHTTHEYYSGLCDELGVDIKHIKVIHDECKHGGWHRICFAPDHFSPNLQSIWTSSLPTRSSSKCMTGSCSVTGSWSTTR